MDKGDKDAVIAQLNHDLSCLREDRAALNEMFQAARGSLHEMADNHVKAVDLIPPLTDFRGSENGIQTSHSQVYIKAVRVWK